MNKKLLLNKWFLLLFFINLLVIFQIKFEIIQNIPSIIEKTASSGPVGYLGFILIYIVSTVMMLPGSPLTFTAGALFGFWKGLILVSLSSTLGATCAFMVSRYLIRKSIEKRVLKNKKFQSIDNEIDEQGWKIVILARLSPIIPFFLLNYALGITKIRFIHFIFASWVGMIPGTTVYVLMGTMGGAFINGKKSSFEWLLLGMGLIATILVTLLISKIVKNSQAHNELKRY
ncbi:TVP38/TMEM64 family protein [Verrucomicrobia bacterium]|nr:TVP38/TMEM64 family protein [Verrucomicrobiota bacterium]